MKHVAFACVAVAPLVWACSSYDYEGMALVSPVDAIVVGDTVSLSVLASDGSMPSGPSVAWASSDTAVATVDEWGVVTGTGPGWVVLEARTADYTLQIQLRVWTTAGPFTSIGAGADHSCGLIEGGAAWCWGSNEDAQLGTPDFPHFCEILDGVFIRCSLAAIPVVTDTRFSELVVGLYHNCALSAGAAYCWGSNDVGQLGDGGTESRSTPAPVGGGYVFRSLTAAGRTTCGVSVDDDALCWGSGFFLADGAPVNSLAVPTPVATGHRFALAATGGGHTCGVTPAGASYCWGTNGYGQLGVATTDSTCGSVPCAREAQEVATAPPFVQLALGRDFSCGLTASGAAHCWGRNDLGQLGDGTRTDRWEVMPVAGGHTFTRLDANESGACGMDGAGLLYCWGYPGAGFGNGERPVDVDQPTRAATRLAFVAIAVGVGTQCGVSESGVTWCWGSNLMGALGNGRTQRIPVTTPTRVIRHPGY